MSALIQSAYSSLENRSSSSEQKSSSSYTEHGSSSSSSRESSTSSGGGRWNSFSSGRGGSSSSSPTRAQVRTYTAPPQTTPSAYSRFRPPILPPAYRTQPTGSGVVNHGPPPLRRAEFPLLPLDSDRAPPPQPTQFTQTDPR